jgi:hypothetical protein
MHVAIGEVEDGRWYVEVTAQVHQPARAYPTKTTAWLVAQNWMRRRRGDWSKVACYPTQGWQDGERPA